MTKISCARADVLAVVATSIALLGACDPPEPPAPQTDAAEEARVPPPNLVIADDLGRADISPPTASTAPASNIDRIAAEAS